MFRSFILARVFGRSIFIAATLIAGRPLATSLSAPVPRFASIFLDCRVNGWTTGTAIAVEGGATSIALDIHLEDGAVRDPGPGQGSGNKPKLQRHRVCSGNNRR
jgi:hypothetical protein